MIMRKHSNRGPRSHAPTFNPLAVSLHSRHSFLFPPRQACAPAARARDGVRQQVRTRTPRRRQRGRIPQRAMPPRASRPVRRRAVLRRAARNETPRRDASNRAAPSCCAARRSECAPRQGAIHGARNAGPQQEGCGARSRPSAAKEATARRCAPACTVAGRRRSSQPAPRGDRAS